MAKAGVAKTQMEIDNQRRSRALAGRHPEKLVALAREHTEKALQVLAQILGDLEQPGAVRVRAAELLIERGWGKTPQQIVLTDPNNLLGMAGVPLLDRIAGIKAARDSQGQTIDLESSQLIELPPASAPVKKAGADFI
jgi:hypothetical protein